jgi:hypothetical protein
MKQLGNTPLKWLVILFLSGCQSMPKEPKNPDSSSRVPVNKTIPLEIQQESLYENPAC